MQTITIIIVVDTVAALASQLKDNVYLIDSNKLGRSRGEGRHHLQTNCVDGQEIKWRITTVSELNRVKITKFAGDMVSNGVCKPTIVSNIGEVIWGGRVESRSSSGKYKYTIHLKVEGKEMEFSASIMVKKA